MRKGKYTEIIEDYCTANGYSIPSGFYRRPASHLAIIRTDSSPHKLVAMTWFKKEDVVYYIEHMNLPGGNPSLRRPVRVFDFKNGEELEYTGTMLSKKNDIEKSP